MRETTEIRVDEHGDETHESWLLIGADRVQSSGTWLFDSDIRHQHYVVVTITRCTRKRDLHRDWLHSTEQLLEMFMSMAQWGAFVSSFGDGGGVPATLGWLTGVGMVPGAPVESRLMESHAEVRGAANKAFDGVQKAFERLEALYDAKAGRRELTEAMRTLHYAIQNAPANVEFAAKSLTEHTENVVAKARADIEAWAHAAVEGRGELGQDTSPLQIGGGQDESDGGS
jgi:hypothetical protein